LRGDGNFNVHLTKERNCEIFSSKIITELAALDFVGIDAFEILLSFIGMDQVER
jgi:hypothetical protein